MLEQHNVLVQTPQGSFILQENYKALNQTFLSSSVFQR